MKRIIMVLGFCLGVIAMTGAAMPPELNALRDRMLEASDDMSEDEILRLDRYLDQAYQWSLSHGDLSREDAVSKLEELYSESGYQAVIAWGKLAIRIDENASLMSELASQSEKVNRAIAAILARGAWKEDVLRADRSEFAVKGAWAVRLAAFNRYGFGPEGEPPKGAMKMNMPAAWKDALSVRAGSVLEYATNIEYPEGFVYTRRLDGSLYLAFHPIVTGTCKVVLRIRMKDGSSIEQDLMVLVPADK